jgi:hypothetical protein
VVGFTVVLPAPRQKRFPKSSVDVAAVSLSDLECSCDRRLMNHVSVVSITVVHTPCRAHLRHESKVRERLELIAHNGQACVRSQLGLVDHEWTWFGTQELESGKREGSERETDDGDRLTI